MAIGPLGGAIYANQQAPFVSSVKADHSARFEFQNLVAGEIVNDKEKEIKEVRPTEENKEIDPDREHQKQEADEEAKKRKKASKNQQQQQESTELHHLDITV